MRFKRLPLDRYLCAAATGVVVSIAVNSLSEIFLGGVGNPFIVLLWLSAGMLLGAPAMQRSFALGATKIIILRPIKRKALLNASEE